MDGMGKNSPNPSPLGVFFNHPGLRTATLGLFRCGTRRRVWVPVTLTLLSIIGAGDADMGAMSQEFGSSYKVGPLPVINGVITPISRVITPVTHL